MVTKLEVLKKARELIRAGWTQEVDARDVAGASVRFDSTTAACFCVAGGINRAARDLGSPMLASAVYSQVMVTLGGEEPYEWNDQCGRTREEVLSLFDRTIQRLEAA